MRRAIKHLHVIQNDFLCVTEGVLLSMLMNGIMRPRGCFNFLVIGYPSLLDSMDEGQSSQPFPLGCGSSLCSPSHILVLPS